MADKLPFRERGCSERGADMGRPSRGEPSERALSLYVYNVPLSDGYDPGGAYWGNAYWGEYLYCVTNRARSYVRFVRAPSGAQAVNKLCGDFPRATFRMGRTKELLLP